MKKITFVTAIAAILAVAPLMVGCGGESADESNPEADDMEGEEELSDGSEEESEDDE